MQKFAGMALHEFHRLIFLFEVCFLHWGRFVTFLERLSKRKPRYVSSADVINRSRNFQCSGEITFFLLDAIIYKFSFEYV